MDTIGRFFKRSYIRAIKKLLAWCRRNGLYKDLSKYLGPGAEVFTTPATGTFHFTFLYRRRKKNEVLSRQRRLTIFLHGRNLYVRGWRTDKGLFEIQEKSKLQKKQKKPKLQKKQQKSKLQKKQQKSKLQNSSYFNDSAATVLKIGSNYNRYVPRGEIDKVRIGPEAILDSFDIIYKSNGIMGSDELVALTSLCHHTAEPVRLAEVLQAILDCFDGYDLVTLGSRKKLPDQVRNYRVNSGEYLNCLAHLLRGQPIPEIQNLGQGVATSFEELRTMIAVPLRDSYWSGEFEHESPLESDPFCPPCPDSMREDEDWVQKLMEEDKDGGEEGGEDDGNDEDGNEDGDNTEMVREDEDWVQKPEEDEDGEGGEDGGKYDGNDEEGNGDDTDMEENWRISEMGHQAAIKMNDRMFRFVVPTSYCGTSCTDLYGLSVGASRLSSLRQNRSFGTVMTRVGNVKSHIDGRTQGLSHCRALLRATRLLRWLR